MKNIWAQGWRRNSSTCRPSVTSSCPIESRVTVMTPPTLLLTWLLNHGDKPDGHPASETYLLKDLLDKITLSHMELLMKIKALYQSWTCRVSSKNTSFFPVIQGRVFQPMTSQNWPQQIKCLGSALHFHLHSVMCMSSHETHWSTVRGCVRINKREKKGTGVLQHVKRSHEKQDVRFSMSNEAKMRWYQRLQHVEHGLFLLATTPEDYSINFFNKEKLKWGLWGKPDRIFII